MTIHYLNQRSDEYDLGDEMVEAYLRSALIDDLQAGKSSVTISDFYSICRQLTEIIEYSVRRKSTEVNAAMLNSITSSLVGELVPHNSKVAIRNGLAQIIENQFTEAKKSAERDEQQRHVFSMRNSVADSMSNLLGPLDEDMKGRWSTALGRLPAPARGAVENLAHDMWKGPDALLHVCSLKRGTYRIGGEKNAVWTQELQSVVDNTPAMQLVDKTLKAYRISMGNRGQFWSALLVA